jgi:hypothetical protein
LGREGTEECKEESYIFFFGLFDEFDGNETEEEGEEYIEIPEGGVKSLMGKDEWNLRDTGKDEKPFEIVV